MMSQSTYPIFQYMLIKVTTVHFKNNQISHESALDFSSHIGNDNLFLIIFLSYNSFCCKCFVYWIFIIRWLCMTPLTGNQGNWFSYSSSEDALSQNWFHCDRLMNWWFIIYESVIKKQYPNEIKYLRGNNNQFKLEVLLRDYLDRICKK